MRKIDHIAITVDNVKESVAWYHDNFECKIIYCDDTWAMLQYDNIKLALVIEEEHPYHIAFEIDGLDSEMGRLPHGNRQNWKYHRDGSVSRYINDPSGNKIELIRYTK